VFFYASQCSLTYLGKLNGISLFTSHAVYFAPRFVLADEHTVHRKVIIDLIGLATFHKIYLNYMAGRINLKLYS